jgi:hypothetical protein
MMKYKVKWTGVDRENNTEVAEITVFGADEKVDIVMDFPKDGDGYKPVFWEVFGKNPPVWANVAAKEIANEAKHMVGEDYEVDE